MCRPPKIIALYSPAPRSGKTTVANYLARHNYRRVSFADPIKEMAVTLIRNLGYSESSALHFAYQDRETVLPEIGVTTRHILQTLGTEFGRECLHPDVWLRSWSCRAKAAMAEGYCVVADDCRFENEAQLIQQYGGELWHIQRTPLAPAPTSSHASEGGLDNYPFNFYLHNNDSIRFLELSVCQRLGVPYRNYSPIA